MNKIYLYAGVGALAICLYFYIASLRSEVKYLEKVASEAMSANADLSRDLNASLKRHEIELKEIQRASDEKEAVRSDVEAVREKVVVKYKDSGVVTKMNVLVDELFKDEK